MSGFSLRRLFRFMQGESISILSATQNDFTFVPTPSPLQFQMLNE